MPMEEEEEQNDFSDEGLSPNTQASADPWEATEDEELFSPDEVVEDVTDDDGDRAGGAEQGEEDEAATSKAAVVKATPKAPAEGKAAATSAQAAAEPQAVPGKAAWSLFGSSEVNEWQARKAAKLGNIEELIRLHRLGVDLSAVNESEDETPAHEAANAGHAKVLRKLQELGVDFSVKHRINSRTPAHYAAEKGHVEVLYVLKELGADISAEDSQGEVPAHWAAGSGQAEMLRALKQLGADLSHRSKYGGRTPAHSAAKRGKVLALCTLKELGCSFTADHTGETPAHLAAANAHIETIRKLKELGCGLSAKNLRGETPLHAAVYGGHKEAAHVLQELSANCSDEEQAETEAHEAAKAGRVEVLRNLRELGMDISAQDSLGRTPAHTAARAGHVEVLRTLHELGADHSAGDNMGRTPAHDAAGAGRVAVLHFLNELGDELLEEYDELGQTPAWDAARAGQVEVLRTLSELGVALDERTVLPAAAAGHANVIFLLKDLGIVNPEGFDNFDELSPAHEAARAGHVEVLRALKELGLDLSGRNDDDFGRTPAHEAAAAGRSEALRVLKELGAKISAKDEEGEKPVHKAAKAGHGEVLVTLKELGAVKDLAGIAIGVALLSGRTAWVAVKSSRMLVRSVKARAEKLLGVRIEKLTKPDGSFLDEDGDLLRSGLPWRQREVTLAAIVEVKKISTRTSSSSSAAVAAHDHEASEEGPSKVEAETDEGQLVAQSDAEKPERVELGDGADHGDLQGPTVPRVPESSGLEVGINKLEAGGSGTPAVHDSAEWLSVELGSQDVALVNGGLLMAMHGTVHQEIQPEFEVLEDFAGPLPDGAVPLSPILDLRPHGRHFPQPVLLLLPVCVGANKAWRSVEGGWEELKNVRFHDGYAALRLDHFCEAFAGTDDPQAMPIKVLGFTKPHSPSATFAIVHMGCRKCNHELQRICEDEDMQEYVKCKPPNLPGTYRNAEVLSIRQTPPQAPETSTKLEMVTLDFRRLPRVSSDEWNALESHFELIVGDAAEPHRFRLPSGQLPAQHEEQEEGRDLHLRAGRACGIEVRSLPGRDEPGASSAPGPSCTVPEGGPIRSFLKRARELLPEPPAAKRLRSFLLRPQAPVTQPSAAEIPEGSAAKPAFFSLRFDRSEVQAKAERIYGLLKERRFPVRLVKAMPGDDFGQLVTGYLGEIKSERGTLLCVCTETYGEKTESEFSTYDELFFAASHGLKVVPLKMAATYPPKPQGEKAKALIYKVFRPNLAYLDCIDKTEHEIALKIAEVLLAQGSGAS